MPNSLNRRPGSGETLGVRLFAERKKPSTPLVRSKSVSHAVDRPSLVGLVVYTANFVASIEGCENGTYRLWRRSASGGSILHMTSQQVVRYISEHNAQLLLTNNEEVYRASAIYEI